jgi:hypothetical protein
VNFHQPEYSKAIPVTPLKIKLRPQVEARQGQVVLLLQVAMVNQPLRLLLHQLVLNLLLLLPLPLLRLLQNLQPSQPVNRS